MERKEKLWTSGHSTLSKAYDLMHELYAKVAGPRPARRRFGQAAGKDATHERTPNRSNRGVREG
jgi:hypothetical protein